MSNQPDEKKVEKIVKKISQLKPSELKARLYENTDELHSEILHKAADALFKEDISGALFLEMKVEDFKEMGLTFGCRNALVKYQEKIWKKPESLPKFKTPGKPTLPPIDHNFLEPGRTLASGSRISRDEGELRAKPEPDTRGELSDQDWDCPEELPQVSETESNSGTALKRKRSSSIFQMPIKNESSGLLVKPTKGLQTGEPSTDGEDEKVEESISSAATVKTDDLLASVENYLDSAQSQRLSQFGLLPKQNGSWEEEKLDVGCLSDVGCVSTIEPGCSPPNIKRPLSKSMRIEYISGEKHGHLKKVSRSYSQIPKVRPRPSETESFELPLDPNTFPKNSTRRTTLAKLRAQNKILKEGWYEKAHGHREKWKKLGWDVRYGVLLKNGMLIYFAELPLEKQGTMGFKRTVDLSVLQKVKIQHGKDDWRIKIHTPNSSPPTHLLRFATKQEMNEWRNLLLQVGGLVLPPDEVGDKKHRHWHHLKVTSVPKTGFW
jgi:hypothetical protein